MVDLLILLCLWSLLPVWLLFKHYELKELTASVYKNRMEGEIITAMGLGQGEYPNL